MCALSVGAGAPAWTPRRAAAPHVADDCFDVPDTEFAAIPATQPRTFSRASAFGSASQGSCETGLARQAAICSAAARMATVCALAKALQEVARLAPVKVRPSALAGLTHCASKAASSMVLRRWLETPGVRGRAAAMCSNALLAADSDITCERRLNKFSRAAVIVAAHAAPLGAPTSCVSSTCPRFRSAWAFLLFGNCSASQTLPQNPALTNCVKA
mmetsp:Transcript_49061/g.137350  ORF Transcript_49061/g.137350 Transcript_49061/m.137350 type:complete len:215 (-) Transcript_49061:1389-2033(-)